MHMHDWNKYRNQPFAAASGFGNLTLDAFDAASEDQATA
jgi:hypothetical protein